MSAFSLGGKTALVTGANTGIGQAVAMSMASAGAHVICAGRRSCSETVAKIGAAAEEVTLDFADPMAATAIFAERPIDILINNAGTIRRDDATETTELDWDEVMDVNLKALFFTCQAFAKAAIARGSGGKIVNIASLLSFQGGIRVPSYAASKHGVAGLTKALCNEWACAKHQRERDRTGLHLDQQHGSPACRSGAERGDLGPYPGRPLGRSVRYRSDSSLSRRSGIRLRKRRHYKRGWRLAGSLR